MERLEARERKGRGRNWGGGDRGGGGGGSHGGVGVLFGGGGVGGEKGRGLSEFRFDF